jgi:uncharacterized protein (TIGR03067 family)
MRNDPSTPEVTMRILPVLLLPVCIASISDGDAQATEDLRRIQGTWDLVFGPDPGGPTMPRLRVVITKDTILFRYPDRQERGWKYTLNPSKTAKEIDWIVEEDPGHPIHQPGIYALNDNTLRMLVAPAGSSRPKTFGADTLVLIRANPADTRPAGREHKPR